MADGDTFLPPSATPLAMALDALEARLFALPSEAITKDPALVDAGLLDHLAWEVSVDVWDPVWSEETRRRIIAGSEDFHKYKGTRAGIEAALDLHGADAHILEWWENGGSGVPGTFEVTAYVRSRLYEGDQFLIDPGTHAMLGQVVERMSPVSRGMSFSVGLRGAAPLFAAAAIRPDSRRTARLEVHLGAKGAGALFIGTGVRVTTIRRARMTVENNVVAQLPVAIGGGVRIASRRKHTLEE